MIKGPHGIGCECVGKRTAEPVFAQPMKKESRVRRVFSAIGDFFGGIFRALGSMADDITDIFT
jgi:hypothetical protein